MYNLLINIDDLSELDGAYYLDFIVSNSELKLSFSSCVAVSDVTGTNFLTQFLEALDAPEDKSCLVKDDSIKIRRTGSHLLFFSDSHRIFDVEINMCPATIVQFKTIINQTLDEINDLQTKRQN